MTPPGRKLRIALIAVAAVAVLGVAAAGITIATFDPNEYKPDIMRAVKTATGRDLGLNGRISLKPSLWPTIQVTDVTFSNPPGFSQPQMASLQSMELQLALLPLLSRRVQIDRLVLIHPDILLETDKDGHSNWQMTPQAPAATGAPTTTTTRSGKMTTAVSVGSIRIQDGTLTYRNRHGGWMTLGLPRLDAEAASPDSPLHLSADASYNGTAFSLVGETGALSRLQDPAATSPWPVKLALTIGAAKFSADGTMTQPSRGTGYDLAVQGTVPELAALTPLLQGITPPPLRDVTFSARIQDARGVFPAISALSLHVGATDLQAQVPGLTLASLDIAAPGGDQPTKVSAAGKLVDHTLSLIATVGTLAPVMPGAQPAAFPIEATVQAGEATLSAKGSIADVRTMTGANLVLTARIPDLSTLSPLVRRTLPPIRQIGFQGTLTDAPGGFRAGGVLHNFALTSPDGDLAGDITVSPGAKMALTAVVTSNRVDLDALQTAVDQMPADTPEPVAEKAAPPAATPTASKRHGRLFSDQPIPFDRLRSMDADVKLDIADLRSGGADYKAIDTHMTVKDGKLTVDPFTGDLPGGHLSASASVDAAQPAPPVHLVLHAPGLGLKSILTAVHEPSFANGNLEVYADLQGAGKTPHAIAESLDGSLGLAIAGGTIDNRLLGSVLGKVMETFNASNLVGKGGASELKCFGMRMQAHHGVARLDVLALRSSLLTMTGTGTVNLGDETLALSLRPQARVIGTGVVIPTDVTGPIRNPSVAVNRLGAAEANAGTLAGAVIGDATPLGIVGGLLGDKLLSGGTTDICPPALAIARGEPVPEVAKSGAQTPAAILKNLFR